MNGRLICVDCAEESSIFAFSAASYRRWSAMRSAARSIPCSRLNSATIQSTIALSKLSPPRWLSPEVEDEDRLVGLLVEPVRERGRGRLVDDAQDVESGDLAGVRGRLALRVVEVRGNGDDRVRDRLAE